jgi:ketosteroid isomerase-like protein
MKADNPNERLVLDFFAVLNAGDLEPLRDMLHEEATWEPMVRDIPGSGTHRGKKGIIDEFLAPVRGMFEPGHPRVEVKTLASKGSLVMAETPGTGRLKDGRSYQNRYAWAIEIRDGKLFAIREYLDSFYVSKLFGSGS